MFEHNNLLGIFSIDFYHYQPEEHNNEINISLAISVAFSDLHRRGLRRCRFARKLSTAYLHNRFTGVKFAEKCKKKVLACLDSHFVYIYQ